MADRPKGMGRGLAAILSVAPKDESEELRELPVELIAPNPRQPRTSFDDQSLRRARRFDQVSRRPSASARAAACGRPL